MKEAQVAAIEPVTIDALPWHTELAESRLAKQLPQSLLVIGRLGDGLERLCLHLASRELAATDQTAMRMLQAGSHPDLHIVRREEISSDKLRQNIVIRQVRDLVIATNHTPVLATHRICVIVPACSMNLSAANALLKSLEEPHPALKFILGCEHPNWLPVTIRSRCQKLIAPRPKPEQALAWLQNNGIAQADYHALALADYAPLAVEASQELLPSQELLADICRDQRKLTGMLPSLDNLAPANWLPWTIRWAADGVRLACRLEVEFPGVSQVALDLQQRARARPLAWLNLYGDLVDLTFVANHPVNKRLLLEHVAGLFAKLGRS